MSKHQIEAFEQAVIQRKRFPVIPSTPAPPIQGTYLMDFPMFMPENPADVLTMVSLRGEGHRTPLRIEDLEGTDAVEQMLEEMSDERMDWYNAIDTVAKMRRSQYQKFPGRGLELRKGEMPIETRALEFFELLSMAIKNGTVLRKASWFNQVVPQINTNLEYWNIKNIKDWTRLVNIEKAWMLKPEVLNRVAEILPWFYERGHKKNVLDFLESNNPTLYQQYATDRQLPDVKLRRWGESRKPGVILPNRARQFFENPKFARQEPCPCCGEISWQ